jgi:hypothetical protein
VLNKIIKPDGRQRLFNAQSLYEYVSGVIQCVISLNSGHSTRKGLPVSTKRTLDIPGAGFSQTEQWTTVISEVRFGTWKQHQTAPAPAFCLLVCQANASPTRSRYFPNNARERIFLISSHFDQNHLIDNNTVIYCNIKSTCRHPFTIRIKNQGQIVDQVLVLQMVILHVVKLLHPAPY